MRTLGQLYQLLVDNFDKYMKEDWGICALIGACNHWDLITDSEYCMLDDHFDKQKPTIISKFWWHPSFHCFTIWWWSKNKAGLNQRRKFLQHLAKKFK